MDRELLIEIGVEELPAAWLPGLTRQLQDRVEVHLKDLRIAAGAPVESYATPRRLTAHVPGIADRQEDLEEEISGPPVAAAIGKDGSPTPAALGFAKKQGVAFEALGRKQTSRGEYLVFNRHVRGKSAVDALPDLMTAVLRDLSFPKHMHWDAVLDDGRGELPFGRPIRWLLFLYGGRVVPYTIGRAANAAGSLVQDVESGALTYGHRFLATSGRAGRSIKVRSFDEYQARLKEHFVVLDHTERRERIVRSLELHARRLGGRVQLKEHGALIDEVADLVEFPGVVAGFFDPGFLALPEEVLATTLVHHQHYFPVVTDKGELKEAFLAVVNTQPQDERVIAKNAERVVTARLRDARFFWESDRKIPLESRLERLHTLLFHKKLGSYRDKAERIERLAGWIASEAFGLPNDAVNAAKAARLAKADLTSDMVFEFPELQGMMGGIYARAQDLPEQVWKAIYYHYLPIGVEADAPPSRDQLGAAAITWAAVSLADKLDTVAGLFFVGERHSGSRDPFGLRRAAQGALRVLTDLRQLTGLDAAPSMESLLTEARSPFGRSDGPNDGWALEDVIAHQAFWAERMRAFLQQRGADPRNVRAVIWATDKGPLVSVSPRDAWLMVEALPRIAPSQNFQQLARAFKRVRNIAKELDSAAFNQAELVDPPLDAVLKEPAEALLLSQLSTVSPLFDSAVQSRNYEAALSEAAKFGPAVDRFFSEVLVMTDDELLRRSRLRLMNRLARLILQIGDISEIVPQTE